VEHLCLEPLVHAVLGPLCICIEVEIPVVDSRYMNAITIKLNHIHMVAAICVSLLVLDYDEERVRGYGIGSAHGDTKILNYELRFVIY
jgi:hypothetical protein